MQTHTMQETSVKYVCVAIVWKWSILHEQVIRNLDSSYFDFKIDFYFDFCVFFSSHHIFTLCVRAMWCWRGLQLKCWRAAINNSENFIIKTIIIGAYAVQQHIFFFIFLFLFAYTNIGFRSILWSTGNEEPDIV